VRARKRLRRCIELPPKKCENACRLSKDLGRKVPDPLRQEIETVGYVAIERPKISVWRRCIQLKTRRILMREAEPSGGYAGIWVVCARGKAGSGRPFAECAQGERKADGNGTTETQRTAEEGKGKGGGKGKGARGAEDGVLAMENGKIWGRDFCV